MEPVELYARRLSAVPDAESASRVAQMLDERTAVADRSADFFDTPSTRAGGASTPADPTWTFFREAAERPFVGDVTRGNTCGFIAGRADEAEMWEVTAKSILEFLPGMRVAVAAEAEGLAEYERCAYGRLVWVMWLSCVSDLA